MATKTKKAPRKAVAKSAGKKLTNSDSMKMKSTSPKTKKSAKSASAATGKKAAAPSTTRKSSKQKITAKTTAKNSASTKKAASSKKSSSKAKNAAMPLLEENQNSQENMSPTAASPKLKISKKNTDQFRDLQRLQNAPEDSVNPEHRK